jgi:prolipoprotein diacylglyceryltransferase
MRPVLFELGPFEVNSWGLMVAIAVVLVGFVLRRKLDRLAARGETAYASSSA